MSFEIIRKSDIKVTEWSGGTTSELFIFPRSADFKLGNFNIRISIATIEVDESTFTSLPGVMRTLMLLEGELLLEHDGHHSARLKQFDQDTFSGDWITRSIGKARDFNVMTKNENYATVEAITLSSGELIVEENSHDIVFIHVLEGEISIGEYRLQDSESIAFYKAPSEENRIVKAMNRVVLIRVSIN